MRRSSAGPLCQARAILTGHKDSSLMWTRVWIVSIALLAQQLPRPFETPWFRKPTRVVPLPDGHQLSVPRGFAVNVFADALQFAQR